MKISSLSFVLTLLIAQSSFAGDDAVVKTCNATIIFPESPEIYNEVKIVQKGDRYFAQFKQTANGETQSGEDISSITHFKITHDLVPGPELDPDEMDTSEPVSDDLNMGEILITLAMTFEARMPGMSTTGLDLKAVREVKIYGIGETSKFGQMGIVEAYDAQGKMMGSYLNLLAVGACK